MKEWRTTVRDYLREMKDAHGNLLKNILLIVIMLAVVFTGLAVSSGILKARYEDRLTQNTALFEAFTVLCDEIIAYMEAEDYRAAADTACQAYDMLDRFYVPERYVLDLNQKERASRMLEGKIAHIIFELCWAGHSREAVELIRGKLPQVVITEICDVSVHFCSECESSLENPVRMAYVAYYQKLLQEEDYKEATIALLELEELLGVQTAYARPAQLYADELRAAGDEAGAEAWLEYVEERRGSVE